MLPLKIGRLCFDLSIYTLILYLDSFMGNMKYNFLVPLQSRFPVVCTLDNAREANLQHLARDEMISHSSLGWLRDE